MSIDGSDYGSLFESCRKDLWTGKICPICPRTHKNVHCMVGKVKQYEGRKYDPVWIVICCESCPGISSGILGEDPQDKECLEKYGVPFRIETSSKSAFMKQFNEFHGL